MGNIIWTNHAFEKNKERQITQNWIEQTINNPDDYFEIDGGKIESRKKFGNQTVTVITAKTESGKYLILSAWIDPPSLGTSDFKKKKLRNDMKKASTIKKIWLTFLNQIGL